MAKEAKGAWDKGNLTLKVNAGSTGLQRRRGCACVHLLPSWSRQRNYRLPLSEASQRN